MCGITGFFSYTKSIDTNKFYQAHRKIAHRGPDDEGFVYKNSKGSIEHLAGDDTIDVLKDRDHICSKEASSLILGHRRLSIIDLTEYGHQPFFYDGYYLVFNGEIYNYLELKEELKNEGYTFTTQSDTEVFLKAYHCWKEEAFSKFNGMWAAAIYNDQLDSILLTRDRFGIKPLYYSYIDDQLIFGSEIKFVSTFFKVLKANRQKVYEYLRFNYINHSNETLFQDIMQLEPGYTLLFSKEGISTRQYWDLHERKNVTQEDVTELLNEAVRLRMRADVPVGSLLSGGIDSSTILGIVDEGKMANSFETFSAVFKEKKYSEKSYIDAFEAQNITLKKHFIYPDPKDLAEEIDTLLYIHEEPFRSLSFYSQNRIYQHIKEYTNIKVLLNGQGADEIFSGYTQHHYLYLAELLRIRKFALFFKELFAFKKNRHLSIHKLMKQIVQTIVAQKYRKSDKYSIFTQSFQPPVFEKKFNSLLKNGLWQNLRFSALREYLHYEDKNSMYYSVESRLPFLDVHLVELAFGLGDDKKIRNGISKFTLRQIAKSKIPKKILARKDKMGFVSPQELWQRKVLKEDLDKCFTQIQQDGIFDFIDKDKVCSIYKKYQNNEFNDWAFIWRVYALYRWKKVWGVE